MCAARFGKLDCVKALLECGASVDETNQFGANAHDSTQFDGVRDFLAEKMRDAKCETPPHPTVGIWDAEAMSV